MKPIKFSFLLFSFTTFLHFVGFTQFDSKPVSEISVGLKVVNGNFIYGKSKYESTGNGKFGYQPTIQYQFPVKLFTVRDNDVYIWLMAQTGLLYINSLKYTKTITDYQGNSTTYYSHNPLYTPVNFGIYTGQIISVGVEVFYAKAFNNSVDIWGTKFLSLGWNASRFKLSAAFEGYAQVKNRFNGGTFVSFEFLWKLKRQEE